MALGLGGPRKDAINPQLSPVGPQQMAHPIHLQGPPPMGPITGPPPPGAEPGGPSMPMVPGLPTGRGNPSGPPGMSPDIFKMALIRKLQGGGGNPGMPPGRPPSMAVGGPPPMPNQKPDIKGMLGAMMATRNSRRVVGKMGQ